MACQVRGINGTKCTVTNRKAKPGRVRAPLTELESQIMSVIWQTGPCSVEAVHQAVGIKRKLKEATVRTLLRRLESKNYLRHTSEGRAYIYHAVEPARSLAARAVRQIIDRFCQGSVEELLAGMVDAKMLSKAELDQMAVTVRKHRTQK
jgi:BlaI family penicillinase repressor